MEALDYDAKVKRLLEQFHSRDQHSDIGLKKTTSNLFRHRAGSKQRLNVRSFNQVIAVDKKHQTITVEGMATFEDVTKASLKHQLIPLVVPELKTITVGGAVSGMAIESSSFRYGLFHESVLAMDVLTADGTVVTCGPDGPHKDLFFGLPNSYGTLGYILKLTIKARAALPYVHVQHLSFQTAKEYFAALERICLEGTYNNEVVDFIDGSIFSPQELYLTIGTMVKNAPYSSDYTYEHVYYKTIRKKHDDYLTTYDYLWRWDTDWFWCSKNVFADRPFVRRLLGRKRLGSRTYSKIMRLEGQYKLYERFLKLTGQYEPMEEVIQDIEVTIDNAELFLKKFQKTIGITPIWVCPTKTTFKQWPYPLYPMQAGRLYVNFGFWDAVPAKGDPANGYYNKQVEDLVHNLGGMKSLYSTSYYSREQFEKLYNYSTYKKLKATYDPHKRFKDLYDKCVGRK